MICDYEIETTDSDNKIFKRKCKREAWTLSFHDEARTLKDGLIVDYHRTAKRKCSVGHRTENAWIITYDEVHPKPPRDQDSSVKRFHRKGFKGHAVNTYERPPLHLPHQTNHQRMLARRGK